MSDDRFNEEAVFNAARAIADPEQRAAYLQQVCPDAPTLQRVEALLGVHDRESGFLNAPVDILEPATSEPVAVEKPGTVIGPYELREQIGEGGFGIVYVADQTEPVRRRVALKIIKPGMDTREVIARFEAERQALAMMDHPNIAKVLDAGRTGQKVEGTRRKHEQEPSATTNSSCIPHPLALSTGRPYFAMELVHGIAITEFCDKQKLSTRPRLELFVDVCRAVQHAHQKGIIHRDLKPSNVMVTMHDDRPVAKVIDFGVAKAIGHKLSEKTVYTAYGEMVGTPLYMSPEQAQMSGLDVDTRSDVYSLGVLLYELLTGTTPFDKETFKKVGFDEMRRMIREDEPPRPSMRISTLAADIRSTVADRRKIDPRKLGESLRGELDWIVMKCLEKDRARRYESASAFADDLGRYLADEPVRACPPTTGYRLRKFVRKHRAPVLVTMIIFVVWSAGIIGTTLAMFQVRAARDGEAVQRREAEEERDAKKRALTLALESERLARDAEADTSAVSEFLVNDVLSAARPKGWVGGQGINVTVREALDEATKRMTERFTGRPRVEAMARYHLGLTYKVIGELEMAEKHLRRAVELRSDLLGSHALSTLEAQSALAAVLTSRGRGREGLKLLEQTLDALRKALGSNHSSVLEQLNNLATSCSAVGDHERALELFEEALEHSEAAVGPNHPDTLNIRTNLAACYVHTGRLEKALPFCEEALRRSKAALGPHDSGTLSSMSALANAYAATGKPDLAIPLLQEAAEHAAVQLGEDHPTTLIFSGSLAMLLADADRPKEAAALVTRLSEAVKNKLGADHPNYLHTLTVLARAYQQLGYIQEPIELLEQVRDRKVAVLGDDHPSTLNTLVYLGMAYRAAGRHSQALQLYEQAYAGQAARLGADHPTTLTTQDHVASMYTDAGRIDEAIILLEKGRDAKIAKLGADHPETVSTLDNLAQAYYAADRIDEAIAVFERVRDWRTAKLGAQHSGTLLTLTNLATAYARSGKHSEATRLLEQARDGMTARLGADHPWTLDTLHTLAFTYLEAGKTAEAIRLYEHVRDARTVKFGVDHVSTASTLIGLARAYRTAGRQTEALRLFEQARDVFRITLGDDHPKTLAALENIARSYHDAGRLPEAMDLLKKVHKARVARFGADDPAALSTLHSLAMAHLASGQIDEALPLIEQVRDGRTARLGANHRETLSAQRELAFMYRISGRMPEAIRLYEQTRDAQVATLGADHPDTLTTLVQLAASYVATGQKLDEALAMAVQAAEALERLDFRHPVADMIFNNVVNIYDRNEDYAKAEVWIRKWLAMAKRRYGVDVVSRWPKPSYVMLLGQLGLNLLRQQKWADAELVLRETVDRRRKTMPDSWEAASAQSMLGEALLEQKKHAEAEPLLLSGYAGLKQRPAEFHPSIRLLRQRESVTRLVRLYEATDKPDEVAKWRKELEALTEQE